MTPTEAKEFARSVSNECHGAADRLAELQATIGTALPDARISDMLSVQLQSLDAVHQTLADLGRIFSSLATSFDNQGSTLTYDALDAAYQAGLRDRLSGKSRSAAPGSVDLF